MAKLEGAKTTISADTWRKTRGRVVVRDLRGQVIVQSWPRKRGRPKSALQQAWVDKFSRVSIASKTPAACDLSYAQMYALGTRWYYRDILAVAMFGRWIRDHGGERITTPTCYLWKASGATTVDGTWRTLPIADLFWDNNDFWNAVSAPDFATARSAGLYLINAQYTTSGTTNNVSAGIRLLINGTDVAWWNQIRLVPNNNDKAELTCIFYFNPGDTIEVQARTPSTSFSGRLTALQLVGITPEVIT